MFETAYIWTSKWLGNCHSTELPQIKCWAVEENNGKTKYWTNPIIEEHFPLLNHCNFPFLLIKLGQGVISNKKVGGALDPIPQMGGWNSKWEPNSSSFIENSVFSVTVHLVDLRPVCKLKFVRCGPVEKNPECSICLGLIMAVWQSSRKHFSKKLFSSIFDQMINFSKKFSGDEFKS